MTLQSKAMAALTQQQIISQGKRLSKRQRQRNESQYSGQITGYDADQGVALADTPAGTIYLNRITTSASLKVAVSIPNKQPIGTGDARTIS